MHYKKLHTSSTEMTDMTFLMRGENKLATRQRETQTIYTHEVGEDDWKQVAR